MSTEPTEENEESEGMTYIGFRLPPRAAEVVDKLAEKQERSKSEVIRDMVLSDLRERTFLSEIDEEVKEELRADGSEDD